ncbi:MAG: anhydro-N-acetylmuramic acid kinase [bacterium]
MTDADADAPMLAIGLMSGTSVDGIDGVLMAMESPRRIAIEASVHQPFPDEVRTRINALIAPAADARVGVLDAIDQVGHLHSELAELYARAANELRRRAGARAVAVIGCHGQTIRHRPDDAPPFTLQLGNGALIAQRTGTPTVTDFRSADIAAGGQGAPLAPVLHRAIFASDDETRAVVNLGGIANITHLPARDHDATIGFDSGPGNTLLDGWCQLHFNAPFDRDGARAAQGAVQSKLLRHLLADEYFARAAPKSTGREHFNQTWLARALAACDLSVGGLDHAEITPQDVQATLCALTAESVARQLNGLAPAIEAAYVCGGGARNPTLLAMLAARARTRIATTAELGVDPQWVEAAAFAWMACQTARRAAATLPAVTGAAKPTIAGAIYYPD